jgi:asparagine synthase (glutamine-hydrolysing)
VLAALVSGTFKVCHFKHQRPVRKATSIQKANEYAADARCLTATNSIYEETPDTMCGIFGAANLNAGGQPNEELLTRMGNVIVHRGPNDHGHYVGRGMAFGMRRLSIIDVAGGHQPIPNEDKSVWVICNGEIYNFKELRKGLEERGHVFSCDSDTEIIAHLYEEEGVNLFKRLRGMFGVAIWDVKRSRLILARDRLGKKPLYVCREQNRILFASEMKSILEVYGGSRTLNPKALREYLALGYVPAPLTLLEGIEKVLPGHYWVIENGKVQDREYWDVPTATVDNSSEEECVEKIREKLLESVRIRLISDVPLGAFLSGGIDSSAIVAAMARLNSGQPVKTYSIGFEGQDSFYNELPYARIVAKAFGTDHHEIIVRPEIAKLLPSLIWHLDEPIADSAFVTTYLVAKMARETVTVILSGVGGDELFGGYRRYLGNQFASYYNWLPKTVRSSWLPKMLSHLPQDRHSNFKNYVRYADAFVKSAAQDSASRYMSYVTLFSSDNQRALLSDSLAKTVNGNGCASKIMKHYFEAPGLSGLNQLIYADLKTSLADDLLALTDKMTMAASIECRAPFVDQELVEMAAAMPESFKIRGFTMKYLLKKAVKPWLPAEIINRKKRGFGAPMGSWIRRDLEPLMDNLLSENQIRKRQLFNWPVVQEMIARHKTQKADYSDQLLGLINLELWCRIFLDKTDHNDVPSMMAAG